MFPCCRGTNMLKTVVPPSPQKKFLALLKGPPTPPLAASAPPLPLNKVTPPTADLTPDEITKIKANLNMLEHFAKDVWLQQGLIITQVWSNLQAEVNRSQTSNDNKMKKFFEDFLSIAAFIDQLAAFIPSPLEAAFEVSAIILGTTASLLSNSGDAAAATGGPDISDYIGESSYLNDAQYHAIVKAIDYYRDHTNDCRDYIFTYKDIPKQATLRSLLNFEFAKGTYYNNWLLLCARIYKRKLVLTEMVKPENQFLDIYFIQDAIEGDGVEHGHVYQPCAAPHPEKMPWYRPDKHGPGTERRRELTPSDVGTGARIWSNEEVRHFQPSYTGVDTFGTDNTDLKGSYIKAIGDFVGAFPSALVFPWAMTDYKICSQKYFIMQGFGKLKDDEDKPKYSLADGKFLNWLFIDDGAGNITNADGVVFRYEFMRTKQAGFDADVCLHAQQITDLPATPYTWTTSCLDYAYGPQNSSAVNKKFGVYTGDLILKNLP